MDIKILDIFIFLASVITGCFFGVMVLTIIENISDTFRKFGQAFTAKITYKIRKRIAITFSLSSIIASYVFLAVNVTRAGIFAGILSGVAIYFKAGVKEKNIPKKEKPVKNLKR